MNSCTVLQLNIQVSQGSAATQLRRVGKFYFIFFCSSSQNAKVKQLLKSVHVHQSYHEKTAWVFFDSQCTSQSKEGGYVLGLSACLFVCLFVCLHKQL